MTKPYDYLIVGAGITGAVFAHEMTERGKKCLVIEKREHIGGNIYDVEQDGILVHRYGAHIFHTSDLRIWDYVQQFSDFNHFINCPVANYCGEIYNLPFNMNTFSKLWNIVTPEQARTVIDSQRVSYDHEPRTVEEQGLSLAGRDIYEKLIRGYTEKQWGRPCDRLPASILKRVPFRFTYDNNYFNDPYQGIPVGGYTRMIEKMLQGCEVRCGVDYLKERTAWDELADRVFFTGMIDAFFGFSEGHLQYRTLRFEDERLDVPNYQGVAVMNFTDAGTPYTRVIEHKHFQLGQQAHTVITREYPLEWKPGMEPYYPINDQENMALLQKYREKTRTLPRVIFCGRLAEYTYYDMDKAVAAALQAAEREGTLVQARR